MRSAPGLLLGVLLLLAGRAGSLTVFMPPDYDEIENPGVRTITPAHVIDFGQNTEPSDIALSTDGRRLVYTEYVEVLDVWAALVSFWPEVVLGLVVLFLIVRLFRVIRRRRRFPIERGPFCKKCAYPTRGLTTEDCPECGKPRSIKTITSGITRRRCLTVAAALIVMETILLGAYFSFDPPRSGSASNWLAWHSERLGEWVTTNQHDRLLPYMRFAVAIRSVEHERANTSHRNEYVLQSDESIYLNHGDSHWSWSFHTELITNAHETSALIRTEDRYALIDLESCRVEGSSKTIQQDDIHLLEFLSQDGSVYYGKDWWAYPETKWYREPLDGTGSRWVKPAFIRALALPIRHRSANPPTATPHSNQGTLSQAHAYTSGTIKLHELEIDGERHYQREQFEKPIHFDLSVHADMLALVHSRSVLLYDLKADRWIAELDVTKLAPALRSNALTRVAISADRRTLALMESGNSRVVFYDLSDSLTP